MQNHFMSLTICMFAPVSATHVSVVQKLSVKKAPNTGSEKSKVADTRSPISTIPETATRGKSMHLWRGSAGFA
jgi:hypothetical protein